MNEQRKDRQENESSQQQPSEGSKKRVHTPEPPQIKDPSRHPSRQEDSDKTKEDADRK